jgi:outer membrane protein assembly factor BamB
MLRVRPFAVGLLSGVLLILTVPRAESAPEESAAWLATLKSAGVNPVDAGLLDWFRSRTLTPAQEAGLAARVRALGAGSYAERVGATEDLLKAGRKALPFVRPALADPDREIARRARWVVDGIEKGGESQVTLAALHLLALRRPAGTAEVLLDYLPFAEEELLEQAILDNLLVTGLFTGKPAPCIVAAVTAAHPLRRSAAGYVMGRSPFVEVRNRAAPLLADPHPLVRYRTAVALLAGQDRRSIPALVALLEKAPLDLASQAESLLTSIALEQAPHVPLGSTPEERRLCHTIWMAWWREYGAGLDLKKLASSGRLLGLRLVVALNGYGRSGAVWEYGPEHKNRWELRDAGGPFDARVLPGGRVLIGEYEGKRVTERDQTGKIHWEHKTPHGVLEVQRLANGNTLVTTNYSIVEVTREGREVFSHAEATGSIFSAQRLPNGHILYGLYAGAIVELDRSGREVRRFRFETPSWGLINIEVLPNGRYLVPLSGSNRIVEMDRTGRIVWEVSVPSPTCVAVLPDGNLLVGSHRMNYLREIDRKGTVLWEKKTEGQIFRVRTR